jgi:hypothetical protein
MGTLCVHVLNSIPRQTAPACVMQRVALVHDAVGALARWMVVSGRLFSVVYLFEPSIRVCAGSGEC